MKKILFILVMAALTGCGTIFQGFKITDHQKAQKKREVPREIRPGILVLDIVCGVVPLIIDFSTGAIYAKSPAGINREFYLPAKK